MSTHLRMTQGFLCLPVEMQCAVIAQAVARQIDDTLAGPPTGSRHSDTIASLIEISETRQITLKMLSFLMQYGDGSLKSSLKLLQAVDDLKQMNHSVHRFTINKDELVLADPNTTPLRVASSKALQLCEEALGIKPKPEHVEDSTGGERVLDENITTQTIDVCQIDSEERPAAITAGAAYAFLIAATFFLSERHLFQSPLGGEVRVGKLLRARTRPAKRVKALCGPIIAALKRNEQAVYLLPRLHSAWSAADTIVSSEVIQKTVDIEKLFDKFLRVTPRDHQDEPTVSTEVKTELEEMSGQVLELARSLADRDLDADARPSLTKLALLQSLEIAESYIGCIIKFLGDLDITLHLEQLSNVNFRIRSCIP